MLDDGRLAATCRHLPCGTDARRINVEEAGVTGAVADDDGVDIVGIAARERQLLGR